MKRSELKQLIREALAEARPMMGGTNQSNVKSLAGRTIKSSELVNGSIKIVFDDETGIRINNVGDNDIAYYHTVGRPPQL